MKFVCMPLSCSLAHGRHSGRAPPGSGRLRCGHRAPCAVKSAAMRVANPCLECATWRFVWSFSERVFRESAMPQACMSGLCRHRCSVGTAPSCNRRSGFIPARERRCDHDQEGNERQDSSYILANFPDAVARSAGGCRWPTGGAVADPDAFPLFPPACISRALFVRARCLHTGISQWILVRAGRLRRTRKRTALLFHDLRRRLSDRRRRRL